MKVDHEVSQEEERFCKICLESAMTEETGELLQPCNCMGSIGFVHVLCLKRTIALSEKSLTDSLSCEICKTQYKMSLEIERKYEYSARTRHLLQLLLVALCTLSFGLLFQIVVLIMLIANFDTKEGCNGECDENIDMLSRSLYNRGRLLCICFGIIIGTLQLLSSKEEIIWKIYNKYDEAPEFLEISSQLVSVLSQKAPWALKDL